MFKITVILIKCLRNEQRKTPLERINVAVSMCLLTHLLSKRFDVVAVHVSISQGVNKVSGLKGQKKKQDRHVHSLNHLIKVLPLYS